MGQHVKFKNVSSENNPVYQKFPKSQAGIIQTEKLQDRLQKTLPTIPYS